LTRYSDVLLLASALQDDLLVASLRETYLVPLEGLPNGDTAVREVLRAYFAAGHNVKSAAAALGIDRATVRRRLRSIEQRLCRQIQTCQPELELALRLDELSRFNRMPHQIRSIPHIDERPLARERY
jgi:DNA-binding PucR family transcriptional regulator